MKELYFNGLWWEPAAASINLISFVWAGRENWHTALTESIRWGLSQPASPAWDPAEWWLWWRAKCQGGDASCPLLLPPWHFIISHLLVPGSGCTLYPTPLHHQPHSLMSFLKDRAEKCFSKTQGLTYVSQPNLKKQGNESARWGKQESGPRVSFPCMVHPFEKAEEQLCKKAENALYPRDPVRGRGGSRHCWICHGVVMVPSNLSSLKQEAFLGEVQGGAQGWPRAGRWTSLQFWGTWLIFKWCGIQGRIPVELEGRQETRLCFSPTHQTHRVRGGKKIS